MKAKIETNGDLMIKRDNICPVNDGDGAWVPQFCINDQSRRCNHCCPAFQPKDRVIYLNCCNSDFKIYIDKDER